MNETSHATAGRLEAGPPIPAWLEAAYPFRRRVLHWDGEWMHFVDEGEGPPVLLMHGNPTWSFLWRKVIPPLVSGGFRVVAPDMAGLGMSSKPPMSRHSLAYHAENLLRLVQALGLDGMTIVGQDWGGPQVAAMAARAPERVRAAVFANTLIFPPRGRMLGTWFHRFARTPLVSDAAFRLLNFPVPVMRQVQGDPASIGPIERRAYRWPLRRIRDRAAPLALARMVPADLAHPSISELQRCEAWARGFPGPVAMVWGMRDPILGRAGRRMREVFPEAPFIETEAGHFLQEEVPEALAEAIVGVAS